MKTLPIALSFLVSASLACTALAADPLVVDLWPGKTPGDVGIKGEEHSKIYQSPILGGPTKLITDVTKPSLAIYLPPKDKNTGTAMLICPGGGYHALFWELEGEEVAAWLNAHGMTGIILKARCPRREGDVKGEPPLGPLLDAQRAVSLVRSRAGEWGIDPKKIGIVGFSAGGHLAFATATSFEKRLYALHRRGRRSQLSARLRDLLLFGLPEGQGEGRNRRRHLHSRRHAADHAGPFIRRQDQPARRERGHVPGVETRGSSD